jgi:hypothetical protein
MRSSSSSLGQLLLTALDPIRGCGYFAGYANRDLRRVLMLPYTQHAPAFPRQRSVSFLVSRNVCLDLLGPELAISRRRAMMLRAVVPKASWRLAIALANASCRACNLASHQQAPRKSTAPITKPMMASFARSPLCTRHHLATTPNRLAIVDRFDLAGRMLATRPPEMPRKPPVAGEPVEASGHRPLASVQATDGRANLSSTFFPGAGLQEADLRQANLTAARFEEALLRVGRPVGSVGCAPVLEFQRRLDQPVGVRRVGYRNPVRGHYTFRPASKEKRGLVRDGEGNVR